MRKVYLAVVSALVIALLLTIVGIRAASAETAWPPTCTETTIYKPAEQIILTCVPPNWNGDLVIYAHGYVQPQLPISLPEGELTFELPDGSATTMPAVLNSIGYAFATTSYHKNGYAVKQGGEDILALYNHFASSLPDPQALNRVFITGGSEGGIIATMLIEKKPELFDGGLSLCAPLGGMQMEANYLGDFRVVFDYFFPGIFSFGVADVPEDAYLNWPAYAGAIAQAMQADPHAVEQLFNVTHAAIDPSDPSSTVDVALHLLGYSIFATNDLQDTAGGNPYGNRFRLYWGSDDDLSLNRGVERVRADWTARMHLRKFYKPNGILQVPLVSMHTTMDDLVPFNHEIVYLFRTFATGSKNQFTLIPINRFGHCNFTAQEVFTAFAIMVYKATGNIDPVFLQLLFGLGG